MKDHLSINIAKYKYDYKETRPSEGIDSAKMNHFLETFYGAPPNNGSDEVLFQKQAQALCLAAEKQGMANFALLKQKFPESLKINAGLITMKKMLECIYYAMHHHPIHSFDALKGQYSDRTFLCDAGTNTNLQIILQELLLGKMGLDEIILHIKREWIKQVIAEMRSRGAFPECAPHLIGMEIHDIASLVNAIAKEFNLITTTQEEDAYLCTISPESARLLRTYLYEKLKDPQTIDNLIEAMAHAIAWTIPSYSEATFPKTTERGLPSTFFGKALDEVMEGYGLNKAGAHVIVARKDGYETGLKPQYIEIIKHALIHTLHRKKLIHHPDVAFSRLVLHMETVMLDMDEDYINVTNVNICTLEVWKIIHDSRYKKRFYNYLLRSNITLDADVRAELLKETEKSDQLFVYYYAIQHRDLELLEKAQSFKTSVKERTILLTIAREADFLEMEASLWEQLSGTQAKNWEQRARWAIIRGHNTIWNIMVQQGEIDTLPTATIRDLFALILKHKRVGMLSPLTQKPHLVEHIPYHGSVGWVEAFWQASNAGEALVVQQILALHPTAFTPHLWLALSSAVKKGYVDVVRMILASVPNKNPTVNAQLRLHDVISEGICSNHLEIVEIILSSPHIEQMHNPAFYKLFTSIVEHFQTDPPADKDSHSSMMRALITQLGTRTILLPSEEDTPEKELHRDGLHYDEKTNALLLVVKERIVGRLDMNVVLREKSEQLTFREIILGHASVSTAIAVCEASTMQRRHSNEKNV